MTTFPQNDPETLTPIQLDKYLRRINIRGEEASRLLEEGPTPPNLRLLIARHIQAISFENIDFASTPKCRVFPVASPEGVYGPVASHVTPIVAINGKDYIADVGFGRHVREPVSLEPGVITTDSFQSEYTIAESTTEAEPNYPYVLMHRRGLGSRDVRTPTPSIPGVRYTVEDLLEGGWVKWYRIDPHLDLEFSSPLFEEGLKHVQNSPTTWFTQMVLCSRSSEYGQLTLSRDNLTVTTKEKVEKMPINGHEEWRQMLKEHFEIELIPHGNHYVN